MSVPEEGVFQGYLSGKSQDPWLNLVDRGRFSSLCFREADVWQVLQGRLIYQWLYCYLLCRKGPIKVSDGGRRIAPCCRLSEDRTVQRHHHARGASSILMEDCYGGVADARS